MQLSLAQNTAQLATQSAAVSSLADQLAKLHVNDQRAIKGVQSRIAGQEQMKRNLEKRRERLELELVLAKDREEKRDQGGFGR